MPRSWFLLVCALLVMPHPAAAQRAKGIDHPQRHAHATRIPNGRIQVDGALSEPEWAGAEVLSDFFQQEPSEGAPSNFKSEVRFVYDDETLYVGAMLYDPDPDRLVSNELKRDFAPRDSDMFGITLDTFLDKLNGYGFFTMPMGAWRDSQVADDGRANNQNWDGIWRVKTAVVENGWVVEYSIPFRSLRFPRRDAQVWGLNVVRLIRRSNEITLWNFVPRSFPLSKPSFAGTLEGIHGVKPGRDLRLKPYGVTSMTNRAGSTSGVFDGGLDVKAGIGTNLVLDGTLRTDFAQVEVDEQQINLTRFSLFFPEKREFFLENQRAFQINSTLAGTNLIPFFSRRIGLSDTGTEIPLIGGARLSGKQGRSTIGLLNITTEAQDRRGQARVPRSNYTFLRYGRDFLNNSSASAFYMGHEQGAGANRVAGTDMQLTIKRRTVVDVVAMHSATAGAPSGNAFRAGVDFDSSLTRLAASATRLDPTFRNDLGFIQRPGRDIYTALASRGIRPARAKARIVREYTPAVSYTRFVRDGLGTETGTVSPALSMTFADASTASVTYQVNEEALAAPFRIHPSQSIAPGRYHFGSLVASGRMAQANRVALNGEWRTGEFWNGTRKGFTAGARFRANVWLATSVNYARDVIDLPGGSFSTNLLSLRVDGSFTTKMFLNAFIQYNSTTREVLSNVRFNVIHHPLSDLYVVYNEGHPTTGAPVTRSVAVKLTQMLAF